MAKEDYAHLIGKQKRDILNQRINLAIETNHDTSIINLVIELCDELGVRVESSVHLLSDLNRQRIKEEAYAKELYESPVAKLPGF